MNRKDPAYLEWVRQQECRECRRGPADGVVIEPHHLKGDFHQSGTAMTAADWQAMALCVPHHDLFHSSEPWPTGEDKKMLQRGWLISMLILAVECGMLVFPQGSTPLTIRFDDPPLRFGFETKED